MKILLLLLLSLSVGLMSAQQTFVKQWDKRFGGVQNDNLTFFQQIEDGGYILGGSSTSGVNGDKSQPNWDNTLSSYDYWIVKIDAMGNKQWDKRYGGFDDDEGTIVGRYNGFFFLGGSSGSGIGGDKSQPSRGGYDYWTIKVDSIGNKLWDKRFGGSLEENLYALQVTRDGGAIFGGASSSGISGDRTQSNWDTTNHTDDFWVVKVDASGNKEWDKRFGGNNEDGLTALQQTSDGGYILGGTIGSDSSGDISTRSFGGFDYWVIKIDSAGNKQWDKRFGGNNDDNLSAISKTSDGGYILSGLSYSGVSGNKANPTIGYWIVKIDTSGNKQWDQGFWGGNSTGATSIVQTSDKGYLLSGSSVSNTVGDKTESNLGPSQAWVVKTDSIGQKQWDKTIFTTGDDGSSGAIQTGDGCYVFGVATNAGVGGYKTQANWDAIDSLNDFWVVKFCVYPTAINNLSEKLKFNVFPNPFSRDLEITLAQQNLHQATISITNLLGQTIYTQNETNLSTSYTKMLDLRYLASGGYWVSVGVDGARVTKEIIKSGP